MTNKDTEPGKTKWWETKKAKVIPPADIKEIRQMLDEEVPSTKTYLEQSKRLKKWNCGYCKTKKIACTCGTCPQCGADRPVWTHGDPDQEGVLGLQRQRKKNRRR